MSLEQKLLNLIPMLEDLPRRTSAMKDSCIFFNYQTGPGRYRNLWIIRVIEGKFVIQRITAFTYYFAQYSAPIDNPMMAILILQRNLLEHQHGLEARCDRTELRSIKEDHSLDGVVHTSRLYQQINVSTEALQAFHNATFDWGVST